MLSSVLSYLASSNQERFWESFAKSQGTTGNDRHWAVNMHCPDNNVI